VADSRKSARIHDDGVAQASVLTKFRRFVNSQKLGHELLVVIVSYLFVIASAWNDGIIGLEPSRLSLVLEWSAALILAMEILSRILFTQSRPISFYALLLIDTVSLLTVIPAVTGVGFLRLLRLLYASFRTVKLIDRKACKESQPLYLLWIYPLVVPLGAAVLYVVERNSAHPAVRTYFDAIGMTLGYALTFGSDRPHTYAGTVVCGAFFVGGIVCIGIVANYLSSRYQTGLFNTNVDGGRNADSTRARSDKKT
jgi:hypothetical protein